MVSKSYVSERVVRSIKLEQGREKEERERESQRERIIIRFGIFYFPFPFSGFYFLGDSTLTHALLIHPSHHQVILTTVDSQHV